MNHSYKEIEYYIEKYRQQGFDDNKIHVELVNIGFNEIAVGIVLKHLHDPNMSLQKLSEWVSEQILKGNDKEEIKEKLMDAEWKEEIIDLMLNIG